MDFLVDPHFLSGSLTEGNLIVLLFEGINHAVILHFLTHLLKTPFCYFICIIISKPVLIRVFVIFYGILNCAENALVPGFQAY